MTNFKTYTDKHEQEVFDDVALHLLKQGKQARNYSFGNCKYRANDGAKCAVGCLIPDFMYTSLMEGRSIGNLLFDEEKSDPGFQALFDTLTNLGLLSARKFHLLQCLQLMHDEHNPGDWAQRLGEIARLFRLSDKVVRDWLIQKDLPHEN